MPLYAQTNRTALTLAGKVLSDSTQQPLEGATVYIPDLRKGAVSDQFGNFKIENIPHGNYLVEVKSIGYGTDLETISFEQNVNRNFNLHFSIKEESEIVVTGSSRATSLRRNPIPVVAISPKYLQQNLSTNVIDAISRVPGVSAVTTGPNVSKPFIRGLGFNRILTLYDGVRQEGQQWGDEHGVEIDQNIVEKVEVVKGPASLTYGSDAVAGVVNLLPPSAAPDETFKGAFKNEYQTNNGLILNSLTLANNKNYIYWQITGTHKLAKDYKNKFDGRVFNTGFAETDLAFLAGINKNWGYTHFGVTMFDDKQEIPDGSRDSVTRKFTKQVTETDTNRPIVSEDELNSYRISNLHQRVQHYRIYTTNSFRIGSGRLGINLAAQRSQRREYSHPSSSLPGLDLQLNTFNYDVKYFFHEFDGLEITGGINGIYQDNQVKDGTEFIIPAYRQFDAGPFVLLKRSWSKLEFSGGLRYDIRTFHNDNLYTKINPATGFEQALDQNEPGAEHPFFAFTKTFSGVSGSAGFSYRLSKLLSMKFNIGRGYRAPNISEISSNGVHPGTNAFQLGNPKFKPEFNFQEDLGINFNSRHITVNAELFNNNISNYIYNVKLLGVDGRDSVIVPGTQTFQYQAAKAQLYGGEFSIDVHPHPFDWLHFENSLSVVYGINKGIAGQPKLSDSAKYLPLIPPVHTFSELRTDIRKMGSSITNGFIKIQLEYYARQNRAYLENDTETPTPAYALLNAGLGADVTGKEKKKLFTFTVVADNILNKTYQSHLNRLKYFEPYNGSMDGRRGIYNMGRNVSLKVDVPLNL